MFKDTNWLLVLIPLLLGVLFIVAWNDIQLGQQLKAIKEYYVSNNCTDLKLIYYQTNDSISILRCNMNIQKRFLTP